ncbi:hypothetical protein ACWE42_00795 [Sutcliffiella cohnii]
MVTAIVIPILIIYFYFLAKKNRKKYKEKWLSITEIKEESVIIGEVKDVFYEKKRFYYDFHIMITHIVIYKDGKTTRVERRERLTKEWTKSPPYAGDFVKLIGYWEGKTFIFNGYKRIDKQ